VVNFLSDIVNPTPSGGKFIAWNDPDKIVFGRSGIDNGAMARDKDGPRDLLRREGAMEVVEDVCGIMTVGEWFHYFCRKLRHDG